VHFRSYVLSGEIRRERKAAAQRSSFSGPAAAGQRPRPAHLPRTHALLFSPSLTPTPASPSPRSAYIDVNMVASSLALAEQHSCSGLKEACLQFLASPTNLKAMLASDGYEHLKSSCPFVLQELVDRLLPDTMKAAKDIIMTI
jgi:hypothetical protein